MTYFARGTLSDTNSDGVPDTISSPGHSLSWGFDALGNWTSLATDGNPAQTRTFDQENENTGVGGATLTYDVSALMWNSRILVTKIRGPAILYAGSILSIGSGDGTERYLCLR